MTRTIDSIYRWDVPSLRQLQYLVAIADTAHFGRASRACGISQPTLSQQLRTLETRLAVNLIDRSGGKVVLTPIGRDIAERARPLLLGVEDIRGLARRSRESGGGTVRFGVTPTLGPYLLPPVVARLHRERPDLRLYMREGIPDDQLAALRSGTLDMVLTPLPVAGEDIDVEPLFREPLHLVAAPDDPLCATDCAPRAALAGRGVLSIDPRHHFHRQASAICEDLGAVLLRDYEGTSLDSLRQMAGSGIGIAILPELYLRSEVGGEDMVCRLSVEGWSASRSIGAVWRRGAAYAAMFAQIAEAIAAEARATLARPL